MLTVTEVAMRMQVNTETVRRWVRQGELIGDKHSRKEGVRISENSLRLFIVTHPKYAKIEHQEVGVKIDKDVLLLELAKIETQLIYLKTLIERA